MPWNANADLSRGFDVLEDLHAEPATYRGATFQVLIDRNPQPSSEMGAKRERNEPDFSERERSVITIKREDIAEPPRSGETLVDTYGHRHAIKLVEPRGDVFYLHCKVSQVPS